MDRLRFLAMARDFSALHSLQTGYGENPAAHPKDTGWLFLRE
jgi:hypothetical protein